MNKLRELIERIKYRIYIARYGEIMFHVSEDEHISFIKECERVNPRLKMKLRWKMLLSKVK